MDEKPLPIHHIAEALHLSEEVVQALVALYKRGDLEWDMMPLDIDKLDDLAANLPAIHMAMAEILDAYQREMKNNPPSDS